MKDFTDIDKQFKKFGNVQNLMSYFDFDELLFTHNILIKSEIRNINKLKLVDTDDNRKLVQWKIKRINLNLKYFTELEQELYDHTYYPNPVRQVQIPKSNGKFRKLGISVYTDKIVQSIMNYILKHIYEPIFLDCSYGYRNYRSCQTALIKFKEIIDRRNIRYIVKADISQFFDDIPHDKLLVFLTYIIKDKYFIMYINRFLKAGIIIDNHFIETTAGTPQGGIISPLLGNIYLHYVLDLWFETDIKTRYKNAELIRYADDFIACFSSEQDANYFKELVQTRLKEYELKLNMDKTNVQRFCEYGDSPIYLFGFKLQFSYNNKLYITATNNKLNDKLDKIKDIIYNFNFEQNTAEELITKVNQMLMGIYNYYNASTNKNWLYKLYYNVCDTIWFYIFSEDCPIKYSKKELSQILTVSPICKPDNIKYFL